MRFLLELSMESESLSRAEALAAVRALGGTPSVVAKDKGILVLDAEVDPLALTRRLGLCHFVSELLATGARADVEQLAKEVDVPGPIRVRSTKVGEIDVDLAASSRRVGAIVGGSRGVDLTSPRSDVRVIFSERAYIGRVLGSVDRQGMERRKNRYMPFVYPASLHPKFARALVNLTCARESERILDPFCGTGAIIAEAASMGLKGVGTDISEKMIQGSRMNLGHLGLSADLHACDVGEVGSVVGKVQGIATDPPYGKSTSTDGERIPDLYARAFSSFSEVLGKGSRAVVVVPDIGLIGEVSGFRLLENHSLWVHRSLTRNFCVLEKV